MKRFLVLTLAACSASNVSDTAGDVVGLEPPSPGEGFQLSMTGLAPAGEEVWLCEVYPLPIDEVANVNRVQFLQNAGTHHMTLSTPTIVGAHDLATGSHDCADLYGTQSLMEDQVMFFGNQGDPDGVLQLPEGVVASMPDYLDVIHEVHFVNTTADDVDLYSYVNAYTIDESDITDRIWGSQVRDETIEIGAGQTHTEWTRCVMNEDVDVLFLASHTHALGVEFTIAPFDGESTGDVFYTNDDWHDPLIVQYEEPIAVPAGTGFEYACTYTNTTDQTVTYGLESTDEMCNLVLVHTPFSMSAQCDVVETSDGVIWTP